MDNRVRNQMGSGQGRVRLLHPAGGGGGWQVGMQACSRDGRSGSTHPSWSEGTHSKAIAAKPVQLHARDQIAARQPVDRCWRLLLDGSRHVRLQCQASLEGAQTNGSVNGAAASTGTVPRCAWAQQASRLWPLRHVLRHVLGLGRAGAGASRPGTVACTRMTSRRWAPRQTARAQRPVA
jgi:hypothetical protein